MKNSIAIFLLVLPLFVVGQTNWQKPGATSNKPSMMYNYNGLTRWHNANTNARFLKIQGDTLGDGQVVLTTDVSGTLPVANGGTGTASPALVAGTNITITGTWPNQTINSSGGGSITGSGTTNNLARWTGTTALGNSVITDNGTNVGISSTTYPGKLNIVGEYFQHHTTFPTNGAMVRIASTSTGPLYFSNNYFGSAATRYAATGWSHQLAFHTGNGSYDFGISSISGAAAGDVITYNNVAFLNNTGLGIGVATAGVIAHKLHVVGNSYVNGVNYTNAGSESLPSIAGVSDPNTGIYLDNLDALFITAGGNRVGRFNSAGLVLGKSTVRGTLGMFSANGATLTLQPHATGNNYTITMPAGVPSTGQTLIAADGSGNMSWGATSADNMGNHTATQALNMNGFNITNGNLATFDTVIITASAYGAGWNGRQNAAPMDAVFDEMETRWKLGTQTLSATSAIGSSNAFGVNLTTNGSARVRLDASGGVRSGTITDLAITASDTIALNSAGPDLQLVSGFASIVDSGGTVRYQVNNTSGATAVTLPDNTATACNFSISGGSDLLVFNSTNGAEKVTMGGGTAGSTVHISADTVRIGATGLIGDGTYTPTLTGVLNVGASTAYVTNYMRVGKTVTLSGRVDIDPVATGSTILEMSLPFAANFTVTEQAGGTFASSINTAGAINADATDDRLSFIYTATVTTNESFTFILTYRIP